MNNAEVAVSEKRNYREMWHWAYKETCKELGIKVSIYVQLPVRSSNFQHFSFGKAKLSEHIQDQLQISHSQKYNRLRC